MNQTQDNTMLLITGPGTEDRSWFSRTFGRMARDSLRGSILIMLLTALGTGIFTLHHVFDNMGMILAYIFIIVFGLCYFLISDILIFAFKYSPYSKSINELIKNILGSAAGLAYDLVFFMYLFLALIAQLLSITGAFYNNFEKSIWQWFEVSKEHQTYEYFNFYFCFVAGFILFFINVKQSIDEFRYFSLISFAIFVYIVLVCLAQSPLYYNNLVANNENKFELFSFDWQKCLSKYGLVLFSYNCIANFFGVVTTVGNPSVRRLRKIFSRTFIILAVLFIIFGTAAYLSLGSVHSKDVDIFVFRFPIGQSDYLMLVGRSLLMLSLCVGSGLNVFPLKMMSYDLLGIAKTSLNNFYLSLAFTIGPVLIAANFTGITNYVAIAGAFSATLIAFTFPGICGLLVGYSEKKHVKVLIGIWLGVLTLMGFVGSFLAFQNFFKKPE